MAACTDDRGRVLLMDTASMCIVRIWKGYRDAHLGWLVAKGLNDSHVHPMTVSMEENLPQVPAFQAELDRCAN